MSKPTKHHCTIHDVPFSVDPECGALHCYLCKDELLKLIIAERKQSKGIPIRGLKP